MHCLHCSLALLSCPSSCYLADVEIVCLYASQPAAGSDAAQSLCEVTCLPQVGNETLEKNTWTRPEQETATRPAYYVSTYNGSSDLAGQISAALTSTAMVFQNSDPAYYAELMQYSTQIYAAGARNRATYTHANNYPCAEDIDSTNVVQGPQAKCAPADEVFSGAMIGTYNSTSLLDDLTWAAAWLNLATADPAYLADAYRYGRYTFHPITVVTSCGQ